ncbi:MAG: hypothetical protein ACOYEV_12115, partial [Candidatus Nanopelagicales bacterium]
RVLALPNIIVLEGHDVVDLTANPDRTRVTGVTVANRAGDGRKRSLRADLVVDATGRGSRTPAFLESMGYQPPREDHVVMRTAYASQPLRVRSSGVEPFVGIGAEPGRPTGLFLSRYEDDQWMFTVYGMLGQEPPGDLSGMLDFVEGFAPEHVLAALRAAEPVGEVVRHRMPSSQWRRYDRLRRFPDGLLVSGDAISSFNPVYGQGMTVAALDALAMRDCLRRGSHDLARRYFRAAARSIRVAWRMAAQNDLSLPQVQGRRTPATYIANRCADWVLAACESDAVVAERFFRVTNFLDGPAELMKPSFGLRVAAANLRRRREDPTSADVGALPLAPKNLLPKHEGLQNLRRYDTGFEKLRDAGRNHQTEGKERTVKIGQRGSWS